MNPFELAREEVHTPLDAEHALAAIDALLRDGFALGDAHYRLFGGRVGRAFSMSLGMPLLGGGAPVLRGRLHDGVGAASLELAVGARYEFLAFGWGWILLTVVGGGYQVVLQLQRVLAGQAGASAVLEVLPGIGLMALLILGAIGLWRRRGRSHVQVLLEQVRRVLRATSPDRPAPIA